MSLLFFAALAGMAAPWAFAQGDSGEMEVPIEAVRALESQLVMPEHAAPLVEYDRYYARTTLSGRDVVEGVFVRRSDESASARDPGIFYFHVEGRTPLLGISHAYAVASTDLPSIADGGCAVVTVWFDVRSMRIIPIEREGNAGGARTLAVCNGYA